MEIKEVDRQGRIVIPKEWRESRGMRRVVMILLEDRVEKEVREEIENDVKNVGKHLKKCYQRLGN